MPQQPGVTQAESPSEDQERIKNLQAEFARKLEDLKGETSQKLDALMQKIDSLTMVDERPPKPVNTTAYDKKEELIKISADPQRYVEDRVAPLKEKADALEKAYHEQRKAIINAEWERMQDRIARAEKKSDWEDLPEEFRKEIKQEIIKREWVNNPASAIDAYEIVKARKNNMDSSDPDRRARIAANQSEGSGRSNVRSGGAQSISRDRLVEISKMPPSHPDYKETRDTLNRVQSGLIKVES